MDKRKGLFLGEVVFDISHVLDRMPAPDEKRNARSQGFGCGGVTANTAIGFSRLGGYASFMGIIGKDIFGKFLFDALKAEGVDASTMTVRGEETPINSIWIIGNKRIAQSPLMETLALTPDDVRCCQDIILKFKFLHTTCIHLDATIEAMKLAKAAGVKISVDMEKQIAARGKRALAPVLKMTDIIFPNKDGAKQLTGEDSPVKAAEALLKMGIPLVVMTMGSKGSVALTQGAKIVTPAFHCKSVDPTGAGDEFCAAFLYYYVMLELPIGEALKVANAAAAINCMTLGAQAGMPYLDGLCTFLANNGEKALANKLAGRGLDKR